MRKIHTNILYTKNGSSVIATIQQVDVIKTKVDWFGSREQSSHYHLARSRSYIQ